MNIDKEIKKICRMIDSQKLKPEEAAMRISELMRQQRKPEQTPDLMESIRC